MIIATDSGTTMDVSVTNIMIATAISIVGTIHSVHLIFSGPNKGTWLSLSCLAFAVLGHVKMHPESTLASAAHRFITADHLYTPETNTPPLPATSPQNLTGTIQSLDCAGETGTAQFAHARTSSTSMSSHQMLAQGRHA